MASKMKKLYGFDQFNSQQNDAFVKSVIEAAMRARAEGMPPEMFLNCSDAIEEFYDGFTQQAAREAVIALYGDERKLGDRPKGPGVQ